MQALPPYARDTIVSLPLSVQELHGRIPQHQVPHASLPSNASDAVLRYQFGSWQQHARRISPLLMADQARWMLRHTHMHA